MYKFDFFVVKVKKEQKNTILVYPEFQIGVSTDLMIRGGKFYAIWDEENGIWSTDECRVQELIDSVVWEKYNETKKYYGSKQIEGETPIEVRVLLLKNFSSKKWIEWQSYTKSLPDNDHNLDDHITFASQKTVKSDYVSKKLPYDMIKGDTSSYDDLMTVLYSPDERRKIEWAIGSVFAGDSKVIQKFIALYGAPGTGKSTVIEIIQELFEGYYSIFDSKDLVSNNNAFGLAPFKDNPLIGIQTDADFSKVADNTKLNSLASHELQIINEKYKSTFTVKLNTFIFVATNKPVKISDAKSGLIRRLIDVRPTGNLVPFDIYNKLMSEIQFELGAIANECLNVYNKLGKKNYNNYIPIEMMGDTNDFYNFVEDSYEVFSSSDYITLASAWAMYKEYNEDADVQYPYPKRQFKTELKNYFDKFDEYVYFDRNKRLRNVYRDFLKNKFSINEVVTTQQHSEERIGVEALSPITDSDTYSIDFKKQPSEFDKMCSNCKAQYSTKDGTPKKKWDKITTYLKDIDTTEQHFVQVPDNHIVIDFDLSNDNGEKDLSKNIEEASRWPRTYAELSKSGNGVHLHYIYNGDVSKLSRVYSDNIEIKIFTGNSALRRKLTKCNDIPVVVITSGLPLKEKSKVINFDGIKDEQQLRNLIRKNLRKEIHQATKPSIDFIYHILDEAYNSGLVYDVTDLESDIMAFANNSTHNAAYCVKLVTKMKFQSEKLNETLPYPEDNNKIIFFDVEVFPNLFVVDFKPEGNDKVNRMINPTPSDIECLLKFKLVGFNNRKYDNHILYARMLGYSNQELYRVSKGIINNQPNVTFREAYGLSYTDVYDFASPGNKMSLKKWEIKLGLHHHELGLPWDEPVDPSMFDTVAEYCEDDVEATDAVFHHLKGDWVARKLMANLSGLTVNDTTNSHSMRIMFGNNRSPQNEFVYTDLSTIFPGYKFENGHSSYMGEDPGEGGYVYSEPGMYKDVALLDIASMHPASIIALNLFGPYTKIFKDIRDARVYIKHKDYKNVESLFDGRFVPFIKPLEDGTADYTNKDLAAALKGIINPIYGLTSASFENPCRDPRNIDNIVAKRGALFMINLKHEVQNQGFTVVHIKTDSIKIADATPEIIKFVIDYGHKYGYEFEHESTYSKMCIVNQSTYIAKSVYGEHEGEWFPTGLQFAVPYVFKTLFSHEPIEFKDLCETKSVASGASIYLDLNENCFEGNHDMQFVGGVGLFCPMKPGTGGGIMYRVAGEKQGAVSGTKGYRWMESEVVETLKKFDDIDKSYYTKLVDAAVDTISKFGDFNWLVS